MLSIYLDIYIFVYLSCIIVMLVLTWSRYPASDTQCQSLPGAMVQKEPGLSHTVVAAVARSGLGPAHQRGHKPTPSQVMETTPHSIFFNFLCFFALKSENLKKNYILLRICRNSAASSFFISLCLIETSHCAL